MAIEKCGTRAQLTSATLADGNRSTGKTQTDEVGKQRNKNGKM